MLIEAAQCALDQRDVRRALTLCDEAERRGAHAPSCGAVRWQCWMFLGEFERAWQESDSIAAAGEPDPNRFWDGSSWADRHVMLRCLHGLGDTIQLIRFADRLQSTCASLTVQCHPPLVPLLRQVEGIDRVLTWGEDLQPGAPYWDHQMEIMELPWALRLSCSELPWRTRYLPIPAGARAWAASLLPGEGDKVKAGIAWQSGPFNPFRSMSFDDLEPLFACRDVDYYCLQLCDSAPAPLRPLSRYAADLLETAALVDSLDIVITVDTMIAHLAGAMGKKTLLMLPWAGDWRWMLDDAKTPWYPNTTLFRQQVAGDWRPVVQRVAECVANLAVTQHA